MVDKLHQRIKQKSIHLQFLFNSQHTSVIDMKSIKMMNKNLQDDDHQSFHESIPPADVGDIITN
jgi:hypothetical protein